MLTVEEEEGLHSKLRHLGGIFANLESILITIIGISFNYHNWNQFQKSKHCDAPDHLNRNCMS